MLFRHAYQKILAALRRQAAVVLVGPRQVGKTTLAHAIAEDRGAQYVDLESAAGRARLADPAAYFAAHKKRLVVLDEIHRAPELFSEMRGVIDVGRSRGRRTGRFLVLGSASLDLLRQSGESLAGRIEIVRLNTLDILEAAPKLGRAKKPDKLWLRGGFPDSFLAANDADSLIWRQNFIRTYLERDVPQFGRRIPAETLRRFWTMLAHAQGTLLNASKLAAALSVSAPTVNAYVDLLADLLLVRRLQPMHINTKSRLVKSPKIYVRDSGLVHALLGITDLEALLSHPIAGYSWEGFAVETLLALCPRGAEASFYRTASGAEIDLLLKFPGKGELWAVEIKRGGNISLGKGFHTAREVLQPRRSFVVYAGEGRFPLGDGVEAIGLREMAELLAGGAPKQRPRKAPAKRKVPAAKARRKRG